jgi:hypothetical protein
MTMKALAPTIRGLSVPAGDYEVEPTLEALLLTNAYCVISTLKRAFRQQAWFFVATSVAIGGYTWFWSRETFPLVLGALLAWFVSLVFHYRVAAHEVSNEIEACTDLLMVADEPGADAPPICSPRGPTEVTHRQSLSP